MNKHTTGEQIHRLVTCAVILLIAVALLIGITIGIGIGEGKASGQTLPRCSELYHRGLPSASHSHTDGTGGRYTATMTLGSITVAHSHYDGLQAKQMTIIWDNTFIYTAPDGTQTGYDINIKRGEIATRYTAWLALRDDWNAATDTRAALMTERAALNLLIARTAQISQLPPVNYTSIRDGTFYDSRTGAHTIQEVWDVMVSDARWRIGVLQPEIAIATSERNTAATQMAALSSQIAALRHYVAGAGFTSVSDATRSVRYITSPDSYWWRFLGCTR